jgi:hypothetical protein
MTNHLYESIDHRKYPSSYSFACQHGSLECEGNTLHSCFLEAVAPQLMQKMEQQQQGSLVQFLICTMKVLTKSTNKPYEESFTENRTNLSFPYATTFLIKSALNTCFYESQGIKTSSEQHPSDSLPPFFLISRAITKADIENCIESEIGSNLLKVNGDLTNKLHPRMDFVPWLTFDGVWSRELMKDGLTCSPVLSSEEW